MLQFWELHNNLVFLLGVAIDAINRSAGEELLRLDVVSNRNFKQLESLDSNDLLVIAALDEVSQGRLKDITRDRRCLVIADSAAEVFCRELCKKSTSYRFAAFDEVHDREVKLKVVLAEMLGELNLPKSPARRKESSRSIQAQA